VVELDNGVAVLHLAEIQPSDLLLVDQVKAGITTSLRQTKAAQAEEAAAQKASADLKAAVAKGSTFAATAASLNLKFDTLPAFVPMKASPTDTKLQVAAYVATTLTPGQVSAPAPVQGTDTLLVVNLDNRAKADPTGLADFAKRFGEEQNKQLRLQVYIDWANWAGARSGTHKPPDLDAYGSVN
jgi:parvulin-like peptidyl-prolyl isomerase